MLRLKRMTALYINVYAGFVQVMKRMKVRDNGLVVAFNQWVVGSSPTRLINGISKLREAYSLPFLLVYAFMYAFIWKLLDSLFAFAKWRGLLSFTG